MEIKRIIKLRANNQAKRIDFPKNFDELIEKTQSFLPLDDSTKRFQFIDEKQNMEINNQEDFEKFSDTTINEKISKIDVNIVDKDLILNLKVSEPKEEIPQIIEPDDDKIKNEIKELVRNKMKDIENNIIQDIYQSIKTQLKTNDKKKCEDFVHMGINCNLCGMKNIKGIRYKCLQCPDYNLCEKCEGKGEHIYNHILIKMYKEAEESELLFRMNKNLQYKNSESNYKVDLTEFKFNSKDCSTLLQQVALSNIGEDTWKPGAVFKCLPGSEIKGKDFNINCRVAKGTTINIELNFENSPENLNPSINEYYVYYQMFNSDDEAFGNVTKFKIIFKS